MVLGSRQTHARPTPRRAAILAAAGVLAFAGLASADQASGDGDLTTSADTTVDLVMAPGETRTVDVGFVLRCTGFNHLDPGQVATYHFSGGLEPFPGAIGTVSEARSGPVPTGWPPRAMRATCRPRS
jgi:hypothetical protein